MTSLPSLPLYIDSSMLVTFRQCPRKFEWEYIHCLRPKGRRTDLVAGAAFAAGLEEAYIARFAEGLPSQEALGRAYRAFATSWGSFADDPDSNKSFARTFQAILDYFVVYPFDSDHVRPMMRHDGRPTFEFSFAIPLLDPIFPRHPSGEPFLYSGRFDAFGHIDGKLVIRDEKTAGRGFDRHWSEKWNLRNQFILYCWAAQQSGFEVNTVVVRGVCIQKTQFQHAEAIKIYDSVIIEKAVQQLARDLHRLIDCYNSGYFDYDFGDACTAFNRPCSFMTLCADSKPERWFADFDRERWDPTNRTSTPIEEIAA